MLFVPVLFKVEYSVVSMKRAGSNPHF